MTPLRPLPTNDGKHVFTEELQAVASIGTVGDSYDNAQAESLIGLYRTECTRTKDPGAASTTSRSPP